MAQTTRVTGFSLPPDLLDEIDELATADKRSRSSWVAVALREIIDLRKDKDGTP